MKLDRFSHLLVCITALVCYNHALGESSDTETPPRHTRSLLFFPILPQHKPISIFSKPHSEKDDEPRKPGGIMSHVGNVLHGGSLSIQIRPLAPFQGILEHAKKILPGGHGTVGRPSHERPYHPSNYERPHHQRPGYEKPKNEKPHQQRPGHESPHEQEPGYEKPHQPEPDYERPHPQRPEYERPHHQRPDYERPHPQRPDYERPHPQRPDYERPHPQRPDYERPNKDHPEIPDKEVPKKPHEIPKKEESEEINEELPGWEDIGEDDYGDGVLQPRGRRPKRFVESKIYHVPLLYRANGRTHLVRSIKRRNGQRTANGLKEA